MPQLSSIDPKVVWSPIPNSSQEFALDTRCNETLFTGTRGPGKSDTQLMRFRRRVGIGYGPFWRGVIFDREYKNLDDLVSKSKRWFPAFKDGAEWKASTSAYKWVWPTGEELLFRVVKELTDYDDYHGQEFPYIGWNELTKYPTSELYDMMISCNRSSFTPEKDSPTEKVGGKLVYKLPNIPLEVFSTTNSWGPGHFWVKEKFIDVAPYGKVVRVTRRVFNPRTQREEDITRTQIAIFGSYRENIHLDAIYVAGLDSTKDENLRRSWLLGDWDVVAGGAFDDCWKRGVHVLPRFKIPENWHIDRSFDWGSSHPFATGWWAEANGEHAVMPDGSHFCPSPGTLIQLGEDYGTEKIGTNKGLKLSAGSVADRAIEYEKRLMSQEWIPYQPWPGPADNQIRDVRESDVDTIEKKMADKGIRWEHSDKSPGSRKNGFQLFRDRLEASVKQEGPGIYFMENCLASIATIPMLPRDDKFIDDVDTTAEDHPWDMTRYRVLKGANRIVKKIQVRWPN